MRSAAYVMTSTGLGTKRKIAGGRHLDQARDQLAADCHIGFGQIQAGPAGHPPRQR
jgi:hypothetical protein